MLDARIRSRGFSDMKKSNPAGVEGRLGLSQTTGRKPHAGSLVERSFHNSSDLERNRLTLTVQAF